MVADLAMSQRVNDLNGFRTGRGVTAVRGARLVRISSLLLAVAFGLGCHSNEQANPDTRTVQAVKSVGQQRDDDAAHAEWPSTGLPEFVFARLDLTTFRNSTGGQREPGERFFSDIGVRPTKISADEATYDSEEWLYSVLVLGRRDFNGDQVEEVAICFTDRAQNGGTYNVQKPLLLQLVGRRAVALSYEIDTAPEAETCQPTPTE